MQGLPGTCSPARRNSSLGRLCGGTGYQLRCPREYEAQVFEEFCSSDVAVDVKNLPFHTKVIGADPTEPFSSLPSLDLNDMVALDYDFVPGTQHPLQL